MFKFTNLGVAEDSEIVAENYSIENDGHLLAIQEAYEELSDIKEAMADTNAAAVDAFVEGRNNGGEAGVQAAMESFNATVMEGFLGDMKTKAVNALKKLWAKIKAFFKSALQYFNALWMSGKKFAEKYQTEIEDAAKNLDGKLKVTMFKYDDGKLPKVNSIFSDAMAVLGNDADVMHDTIGVSGGKSSNRKESEVKKIVTGKICNKFCAGTNTPEQMEKGIRKAVHGGKENPVTFAITEGDVTEFLKVLTGDDLVKDCEDAAKDADSNFKEEIDKIEGMKDDLKERDDKVNVSRQVSRFITGKDIAMRVFSVYKSLVSEREAAYKSALNKVLHYSPKDED